MDDGGATVVRRAGRADLDPMAAVLGEAFGDYPATRWTVDHRDHVVRITRLQRLFLEHVGLPFGTVWLAEVDGAVASVAVWMDSRVEIPPAVWRAMATEHRALEGDRAAASIAADELLDPIRPTEPHLYLGAVGTATGHQRRGLARRVLAVMLDQADGDRLVTFLETSTRENVTFYRSLGFEVTERVDIPGGPTTWGMLRPPAPNRPSG